MQYMNQPSTAPLFGVFAPLYAVFAFITLLLSGCGGSDSGASPSTSAASTSAAFSLSGTPATSAIVGAQYMFQPAASQPTPAVSYSITGQPSWATFNSATGALSGTPDQSAAGTSATVTITASNGGESASIGPFTIAVKSGSGAPGSVTLNWEAPAENTNGTAATEIIGYYIYYGTSPDNLDQWVVAWGADTSSGTVTNLAPGTYYFSVAAYNWMGVEGTPTGVVSTTI
jgi:Putative Ig domain